MADKLKLVPEKPQRSWTAVPALLTLRATTRVGRSALRHLRHTSPSSQVCFLAEAAKGGAHDVEAFRLL